MNSLFDVSLQLVMVLSLAVSGSGPPSADRVQAQPPAAVSALQSFGLSEQSWLAAVKSGAGGSEMAPHRASVFQTSNGRYYVPAAAERDRLATLARDPEVVVRVVLDVARRNAEAMAPRIGRPATPGDLYAAHVLGADTATALIAAASRTPDMAASKVHPSLAAVAPALKGKDGRSMTAAQLLGRLTRAFPPAPPVVVAASAPAAETAPLPPPLALRGPASDSMRSPIIPPPMVWSADVHSAP